MAIWNDLHELLKQQIREHLGWQDRVPPKWHGFVLAVDAFYKAAAPSAREDGTDVVMTRGGGKPRLLLAEDNATNRNLAERMLQKLGCTVDLAGDGNEAVDAAAKTAYDLILMDCQMPGLDGYEATERIRTAEETHRVPVIALTAYSMEDVRQRCLDAGMDDYLSKPFRLTELRDVLQRWLRGDDPPGE